MNMFPEIISEQNRKKVIEDMESIRLEEEAIKKQTFFSGTLTLLGDLMVTFGEKLRDHSKPTDEANSVNLASKAM